MSPHDGSTSMLSEVRVTCAEVEQTSHKSFRHSVFFPGLASLAATEYKRFYGCDSVFTEELHATLNWKRGRVCLPTKKKIQSIFLINKRYFYTEYSRVAICNLYN
jgi:hypothetical protein